LHIIHLVHLFLFHALPNTRPTVVVFARFHPELIGRLPEDTDCAWSSTLDYVIFQVELRPTNPGFRPKRRRLPETRGDVSLLELACLFPSPCQREYVWIHRTDLGFREGFRTSSMWHLLELLERIPTRTRSASPSQDRAIRRELTSKQRDIALLVASTSCPYLRLPKSYSGAAERYFSPRSNALFHCRCSGRVNIVLTIICG